MIVLTSDHAGYRLKTKIIKYLDKKEIKYTDNGVNSLNQADYPDLTATAGKTVNKDSENIGVFICGSGAGMCIAANKINGIRAVKLGNIKETKLAKAHNNANVICLGARFISYKKAIKIIKVFLKVEFEGGRHLKRISKITKLESK